MPMKRRISKQRGVVITGTAIGLFDQMRRCRCTCSSPDSWIHGQECAGCRRWDDLHFRLHRELKLRLWMWPAVERDGPFESLPLALEAAAARRVAPRFDGGFGGVTPAG